MSHSFSTTIPHILLAGISLWSLKKLPQNSYFGYGCYSLYLTSGILGMFTYGSPNYGIKIRNIYYKLWNITVKLCIPLFTTQYFLTSGVDFELSIINMLLPITYFFKLIKSRFQPNLLCMFSLSMLSIYTNNYYGISTVISYIIAEYGVHKINGEVPPKDLFTYALCFAQFFSLKSLIEAEFIKTLDKNYELNIF